MVNMATFFTISYLMLMLSVWIVLCDGRYVRMAGGHGQNEPYEDRDYKFAYSIKDDYTYNQQSREENKYGNTITGRYTVLEPTGNLRVVNYIADDYGFRANVQNQEKYGPGYGGPGAHMPVMPYEGAHSAPNSKTQGYSSRSLAPIPSSAYKPKQMRLHPLLASIPADAPILIKGPKPPGKKNPHGAHRPNRRPVLGVYDRARRPFVPIPPSYHIFQGIPRSMPPVPNYKHRQILMFRH